MARPPRFWCTWSRSTTSPPRTWRKSRACGGTNERQPASKQRGAVLPANRPPGGSGGLRSGDAPPAPAGREAGLLALSAGGLPAPSCGAPLETESGEYQRHGDVFGRGHGFSRAARARAAAVLTGRNPAGSAGCRRGCPPGLAGRGSLALASVSPELAARTLLANPRPPAPGPRPRFCGFTPFRRYRQPRNVRLPQTGHLTSRHLPRSESAHPGGHPRPRVPARSPARLARYADRRVGPRRVLVPPGHLVAAGRNAARP